MAKIETGENVIIVLHGPREKFWGVLHEIGASGVFARGIDLNAFDEYVRAVRNSEAFYGVSETFFPMWRIERVSRDESSGDIQSMAEQFRQRTGTDIGEW
jgi:uncharacterized 2Fe-2S/4Fe-4S cluster protein (DUF4445 family)